VTTTPAPVDPGVSVHLDAYSYFVPADMEWARPLFILTSKYLDLYDQLVSRWRISARVAQKSETNGVLLGLGDRSREAVRSSQILTGHGLYKDAVQVVRPVVEAAIYAAYMFGDGPDEAKKRASTFAEFQAVERKRNLEAIASMGRLADMRADVRGEIESDYAAVETNYGGSLFSKSAFGCTFWKLAEKAKMQWLYRTAYNHASAFSHLTVGSLAGFNSNLSDLGLGLALTTFPVVFRIMDGVLGLSADPHLKGLELETNDVCARKSP
jgi:hypothetical protein